MRRRDIVAQRLTGLTTDFPRYVQAFDDSPTFSPEQLAAHRQTVLLRQAAGTAAASVRDPAFVQSLRATLVAWRLDSRASRLVGGAEFAEALHQAAEQLAELEEFAIDAEVLPQEVPEGLLRLIQGLGVVDNQAKLVAGTKALHHLLPHLVPPMDRAWTGKFFGLHAPEWHSEENQRRTFHRIFLAFRGVAMKTQPQQYVTGRGWRTSRTKILDNALIAYTRSHLLSGGRLPETVISFTVPGAPPAKSEALSMLGPDHRHAPRVQALLIAAREALKAHPDFEPVTAGPVALDLIVHPDSSVPSSDATNYLGGVADALEDKTTRGAQVAQLGDLVNVWLYKNDSQIKQVHYREEPGAPGYTVTVRLV